MDILNQLVPFNGNYLTFAELLSTFVEAGEWGFGTICYLKMGFS